MASNLTDAQKAEADALFAQLEKESEEVAYNYMLTHVPAVYSEYFIETHPAPTPPAEAPAAQAA